MAYYCPQTKFAKVMFLQVSVCPQGASTWVGTPGTRYSPPGTRYPPRDQVHPPGPGNLPGPDTPRDQVHPPGQVPPGPGTPPKQCMLGDTGNKWAVRILLECILGSREICLIILFLTGNQFPAFAKYSVKDELHLETFVQIGGTRRNTETSYISLS